MWACTSAFWFPLHGLLYYYGIQIHHFNPNSILHISIIIQLCGAFLGIEPPWDLFRYLFHLKAHPNAKSPHKVGGYVFQLRQGRDSEYIENQLTSNLPGWRDNWFYIGNHLLKLPDWTQEAHAQIWK